MFQKAEGQFIFSRYIKLRNIITNIRYFSCSGPFFSFLFVKSYPVFHPRSRQVSCSSWLGKDYGTACICWEGFYSQAFWNVKQIYVFLFLMTFLSQYINIQASINRTVKKTKVYRVKHIFLTKCMHVCMQSVNA